MQIWTEDIKNTIKYVNDFLNEQYKEQKEEKKRDWRTYEQQLAHKMKQAIRSLDPLENFAKLIQNLDFNS
ncbi:hypothetical protein HY498_01145 [Candidatus Woesearchaeota archaeon]|nr:hypothetical protein [Candidatus Woesearchaeota archaeon]